MTMAQIGVLNGMTIFSLPALLFSGDGIFSIYEPRLVPLAILIVIFTSTYVYTVVQSYFAKSPRANGARPPHVPYVVPFLGNTYAFVSSPADFLTYIWYVCLERKEFFSDA